MAENEDQRGTEKAAPFTGQTPRGSRVTISEIAELRKIFDDSKLAKWVMWAGIGGVVELIRLLFDLVRWAISLKAING